MMHFSFYWSFRTLVVTALLRPLCCQIKNPCQLSLLYTIVSHFSCPRATAVALLDIALGSQMSHPRDPNCDRGIDHPLDHFGIVELIILVTHLGTRLIIHPPIWGSRHHFFETIFWSRDPTIATPLRFKVPLLRWCMILTTINLFFIFLHLQVGARK